VGAAFGRAVGQVGAVGGRAAVPHHLARDRRGRTVKTSGDLRGDEAVGGPSAICRRSGWVSLPPGIAIPSRSLMPPYSVHF
jgi:hypothetical protein